MRSPTSFRSEATAWSIAARSCSCGPRGRRLWNPPVKHACWSPAHRHGMRSDRPTYQLAEIQRLRGELAEAEQSYRQARLAGRDPGPGMSLLRLAQGVSTLLCPRSDGRSTKRRIRSLDHACCWRSGTSNSLCCVSRTTRRVPVRHRTGNVGDVAPVPWVETLGSARVTTRMPGRVSSGRRLCASRRVRATILQTFSIYENIAKIPIQEDGGDGRSG